MNSDLVELGWTDEQWNRISAVVTDEAQKARVAAQVLPVVGPEDPTTLAIPNFTLRATFPPIRPPLPPRPLKHLTVDSDPTLFLTTIAVNVPLRSHEIADPELKAALVMFRAAANYVARIEDALVISGRPGANLPPPGLAGVPAVFSVTGNGASPGLFAPPLPPPGRLGPPYVGSPSPPTNGNEVFNQVIGAIQKLEAAGQTGPFGCLLSHNLFSLICTPTPSLVLPRDRILPFLQGPLLRCSQIANGCGLVIALNGNPVELVVARDISVQFLQTTLDPRYVFRVSEKVAIRIKESQAIALLM